MLTTLFFFLKIFIWLHRVSVAAHKILVAARGILVAVRGLLSSCGVRALEHAGLVAARHMGS